LRKFSMEIRREYPRALIISVKSVNMKIQFSFERCQNKSNKIDWLICDAPDFYFRGAWFESQLRYCLLWLRCVCSRHSLQENTGTVPQLGYNYFLPNLSNSAAGNNPDFLKCSMA
jgi:hypothetical protein